MPFATLSNDFHNTSTRVRSRVAAYAALDGIAHELTPAQRTMARRLRRALCGTSDCACGVVRGEQESEVRS